MIIFLYSKYSESCKLFNTTININSLNFIDIKLCVDDQKIRQVIKKYNVKCVPCILIVTNNGFELHEGQDAFIFVERLIQVKENDERIEREYIETMERQYQGNQGIEQVRENVIQQERIEEQRVEQRDEKVEKQDEKVTHSIENAPIPVIGAPSGEKPQEAEEDDINNRNIEINKKMKKGDAMSIMKQMQQEREEYEEKINPNARKKNNDIKQVKKNVEYKSIDELENDQDEEDDTDIISKMRGSGGRRDIKIKKGAPIESKKRGAPIDMQSIMNAAKERDELMQNKM